MTKRSLAASNLTDEWDTSLELSSAWILFFLDEFGEKDSDIRTVWDAHCTVETTTPPPILVFLFFVFTLIHQFIEFWTMFFVTDWLAEAGNPCLCNQAAHIHPGGVWGCLIKSRISDKPVQYRLFHRSSLPWWFASSPPTSVWSYWWEETAKSTHPKKHQVPKKSFSVRLTFQMFFSGPPCVLLPCICLHGLGSNGPKIKVWDCGWCFPLKLLWYAASVKW